VLVGPIGAIVGTKVGVEVVGDVVERIVASDGCSLGLGEGAMVGQEGTGALVGRS